MPLMRSGKLTAPSWCCAAPESAMSWVSVSLVPLRVVISASIRLKSGHVRPVTTATPLRPLDQRGSFEADGSPCASALLMRTAICCISALKGRVSGAGLCSPFSNFRLAVAETGSIADRDRFAECPSGIGRAAGTESTASADSLADMHANRPRIVDPRPPLALIESNSLLGSNLVAFLGAGLAGFAAGFAFGDLREFFTFFLAVPANHRDHLGEMASMLRIDRRQRLQGAASGYERNDRVGATGHGRVLHRIHAKAVP